MTDDNTTPAEPSKAYRARRDRIEVHVEKGLREKYRTAIAPNTMKGGIEGHMKAVVKNHKRKK
jgi:hypothetical protein